MRFSDISRAIRMAHATAIEKEIASVAVTSNGSLLIGKRRDNGKWTFPGGHLNAGETAYDGATRELWEEAGISAGYLHQLGSESITTFSGKPYRIHAFGFETTKRPATSGLDPDAEIVEWKWVPMRPEIEEFKSENLHSPKNVVLKYLGLQSW